jgi:hypothetical protein
MPNAITDSSQSTCPELLKNLSGDWFIVYSNFPMWTKAKRRYPMLHYTIERREGEWGLTDSVTYLRGHTKKYIHGFDNLTDKDTFIWRGSGMITKHLSSKWGVVYINPDGEWAIIRFEKTLFTPAGYDVISRNSLQSDTSTNQINQMLKRYSISSLDKITQRHSL